MTEQSTLRSGMLTTIYEMLPAINDDYAAKLVYTLEDKKTLAQLRQDIADMSAQLNSDSPSTDTLVAKMLLDEITLPAALRQLRIYNNAISVAELCQSVAMAPQDTQKILEVYASFSSRHYFDQAFSELLQEIPEDSPLTDDEKASQAANRLLDQAEAWLEKQTGQADKNKQDIAELVRQYHLSAQIAAELELLYTQPASISLREEMTRLIEQLSFHNGDTRLCAFLAAQVMLGKLTVKDAEETAQISKLANGHILEEDLLVIACRYLKTKTPKDIVTVFNTVLSKLPHVKYPAENLGLAVRVLLEGTPESFNRSCRKAAMRQERELLRQGLTEYVAFAGYEHDLAELFGGKKTAEQLRASLDEILQALPYCTDPLENKELACKVLLGTLSQEEAVTQAKYLQNLKAQSLTKGLAPGLLRDYLGTQPAEEVLAFLEASLAPYTFWKTNRPQHEFALRVLVGELNGQYNRQISQFVLDMFENGSSLEVMADMLSNIQTRKTSPADLEKLLHLYKQARAESKLSD